MDDIAFQENKPEHRSYARRGLIIGLVFIFIIFGSFFVYTWYKSSGYQPLEYNPENYCENDFDCVGGSSECRSIFKGSKTTSQAITGNSIEIGMACTCFTNRCEVLTEERRMAQENCRTKLNEEKYNCYKEFGEHLMNSGLCHSAGQYADECYFQAAKNRYSINTCEKAGKYNDDCEKKITELLEKTCELVKPISKKRSCYFDLAANILPNAKYCDTLSSYPAGEFTSDNDYCYYRVAEATPDSSALCEKAGKSKVKCLAFTTGNEELCKEQDFEELCGDKKTCIEAKLENCIEKVKAYQGTNFEKKYPDGNFKNRLDRFVVFEEDCEIMNLSYQKEFCYSRLAENLIDSSFCDKVENEYQKQQCVSKVKELESEYASESAKSEEDCNQIEEKEFQEQCYHNLAQKLKNINMCYTIKTREPYHNCARELIKSLTFVEECESMDVWKDQCYTHLARKSNDPGICDKVNYDRMREFCMIPFITEPDGCETLKMKEPQSVCYYEFAKKLKEDAKFCDKIRDESKMDSCKEYASDNWKAWKDSYEVPSFEFYLLPGNPTLY